MKKVIALLLLAGWILSLAACSSSAGGQGETKEQPSETISPEQMTAARLYEEAANRTRNLTNTAHTTTVSGTRQDQIITRRIRKGYEGFFYFRQSEGETLTYVNGRAFLEFQGGKFQAESSTRNFQTYLEEATFPVTALNLSDFSSIRKEGLSLVYSQPGDQGKKQFSPLGMTVFTVEGKASLNEELLIVEEEYVITGEAAGQAVSLTVKTKLTDYRSSAIQITSPVDENSYLTIGNIRIPRMMDTALDALQQAGTFQAALVTAEEMRFGDWSYSLYDEATVYRKGSDYYHSLQRLNQAPKGQEFHLLQTRVKDGIRRDSLHELTNATLISMNESSAGEDPLEALMSRWQISLSQLSSLTLSEGSKDYTVSFVLSQKELEKRVLALASSFAGDSFSSGVVTGLSCSGTVAWQKESGAMTAISLNFQATLEAEQELPAQLSGRYSFSVDYQAGESVPELQTPTPTFPGQKPAEGSHD